MKVRESSHIDKVLRKKGFVEYPSKHHCNYFLVVDGIKTHVNTYLSHGKNKTMGKSLMSQVKKEMFFNDSSDMDNFFDCHIDGVQYVAILRAQGTLT